MNEIEKHNRRQMLLAHARECCMVTPAMVREAVAVELPMRLVWCAAGSGLASYHKSINRFYGDLRAELGEDADKLPQAFYDGYNLENLRADYQLA